MKNVEIDVIEDQLPMASEGLGRGRKELQKLTPRPKNSYSDLKTGEIGITENQSSLEPGK